jgi:anti-sigma B factor antagonist
MGGNRSFGPGAGEPGRIRGGGEAGGSASFDISQATLEDGPVVFVISGELDLASAPRMKRTLTEAIAAGARQIVLDLAGVTFIDSTALGVLVGIQRNLRDGARLAIAGAVPDVLNVFELTGLDATFDIFGTVDQALSWVRGSEAATG